MVGISNFDYLEVDMVPMTSPFRNGESMDARVCLPWAHSLLIHAGSPSKTI